MIHQIMNMKNISAGKNTFYICLQTFVYHRSGSHIAQLHTCLSGKLILRAQTNRKKKRIAFKKFLCRLPLINAGFSRSFGVIE